MVFKINWVLALSTCILYVNASANTTSGDIFCNLINSLSSPNESRMLTRFNAVFFGDFTTGKNAGSQGPLAIGGSFKGEGAMINQRQQINDCELYPTSHGLVLNGLNYSPKVRVHGHAYLQQQDDDSEVNACSTSIPSSSIHRYNFDQAQTMALNISRQLVNMFPSWTIDSQGVLVKIMAEGINIKQPYSLFSLPMTCQGQCESMGTYFSCDENRECQIPKEALSNVADSMLFGNGTWTGPVQQVYPQDKLVVFNVPVLNGQVLDIKTTNPSAGLNACNTVYHFYAVDQQGRYMSNGKFVIQRHSKHPFSGMMLAPQAHIIDSNTGAFVGQLIAASYEAQTDGVQIKDYMAAGNEKCQMFYHSCEPNPS